MEDTIPIIDISFTFAELENLLTFINDHENSEVGLIPDLSSKLSLIQQLWEQKLIRECEEEI